jgi:ADP-ribosylglycohydrolase
MIRSSFTFITEKIKSLLLGVAVGDALGVPVEFKSREFLRLNPVTDMMGYGTHHQPPGTFSDDSSLTFCLAEMHFFTSWTNRFKNGL